MFNLTIYPIAIPPIQFEKDLDFLVMELPPRYMPMMPNGLGHVANILKSIKANYQVFDANIILYHLFHSHRILNGLTTLVTDNGFTLPEDPWSVTFVDEWDKSDDVQNYFSSFVNNIILEIIKAKPKIVGFSLNGNNIKMTEKIVSSLRVLHPECIIVVGGYTCVFHEIGPKVFSDYDYMMIGETELTLGNLVKALLKGERPFDLAGIRSKRDTPNRVFVATPVLHDLDSIDFPRYEWIDYDLYVGYDGYKLIPIAGSRGCVWARCTFCSEKFQWRRRSSKNIVDEFEWHSQKGGFLFHFNESDLNGDPKSLVEVCQEIIHRGLIIKLVGQLRIHKDSDRAFFDILKSAGFDSLRFGVDGWSKNANRIQKKGYPMSLIDDNLKACHEAGISVGVNIVIGVPGETEEDIIETIRRVEKNKQYITKVENVNILILAYGSDFYANPEKYNIKFYGDKEELYTKYPIAIPSDLWYWEKDGVIVNYEERLSRLTKLLTAFEEMGLYLTPFTKRGVQQKLNTDIKEDKSHQTFAYSLKEVLQHTLIVYGVGEIGKRVIDTLEDTSKIYFTDTNSQHWGKQAYGIPVISNKDILKYGNHVLIASISFENEIKDFLIKTYGENLSIITLNNLH